MVTLDSTKLFRSVPAARLHTLREAAREISFPAGQPIFKEGSAGDGIYVVKEGLVEIAATLRTGDRHVFAQVGPGEVFGELAVLDHQPRSACASAAQATTVFFIPRECILNLLKACPEMALEFIEEISRRLREFNREHMRQVLQAEQMALVGRFASSIVHDLKNPLFVIQLAADLAAENSSPHMRQEARQRIGRQVERINSMVNDILEFTRGPGGPVSFTELDYRTLVHAIIDELKPETEFKGVKLEYGNELPAIRLSVDPKRLTRVFHNLIGNAQDAMPAGGTITLRFMSSPDQVVTEIEDSGRGIPDEIAEHLFEPFVTHGKARGTGLGLSICRRIIEEHGGTISARNKPGAGAVFAFSLPTRARPDPAAHA